MANKKTMIDPDGRYAPIIEGLINDMGCKLVRVALLAAGKGRKQTLQILIEPLDGGHTPLDKCVDISRALSALMDVEDPVRGKYVLEVSSPGMGRPLTRFEDFQNYMGQTIKLELKSINADGRKRFRGELNHANDDNQEITLQPDDTQDAITIRFQDLAMAKVIVNDDMIKQALKKADTQQPEEQQA